MKERASRYDRAYYDRWYRDPRHRIATAADVERRVLLLLGVSEFVLGRRVSSVLDVGCGEATWRAPLRRFRRGLRYVGVDSSEYAVRRFGRSRGVRRGDVTRLEETGLRGKFDIVICADVLHFLGAGDVKRGLEQIAGYAGGVAYLPTFTSADDVEGDVDALRYRSPGWYLARTAAVGLVPLGFDFYAHRSVARELSALELPHG